VQLNHCALRLLRARQALRFPALGIQPGLEQAAHRLRLRADLLFVPPVFDLKRELARHGQDLDVTFGDRTTGIALVTEPLMMLLKSGVSVVSKGRAIRLGSR
jgi:hypothetical protein